MRQARWNLAGLPICINRSYATDSHIVFTPAFLMRSPPFSPIKMLKVFFRVLICFEKLVVERNEEKILKTDDRWNTVRGNPG